jgi:hypothetical protein
VSSERPGARSVPRPWLRSCELFLERETKKFDLPNSQFKVDNMAGPSDKARYYLEHGVSELNELERKKIFSRVSLFVATRICLQYSQILGRDQLNSEKALRLRTYYKCQRRIDLRFPTIHRVREECGSSSPEACEKTGCKIVWERTEKHILSVQSRR